MTPVSSTTYPYSGTHQVLYIYTQRCYNSQQPPLTGLAFFVVRAAGYSIQLLLWPVLLVLRLPVRPFLSPVHCCTMLHVLYTCRILFNINSNINSTRTSIHTRAVVVSLLLAPSIQKYINIRITSLCCVVCGGCVREDEFCYIHVVPGTGCLSYVRYARTRTLFVCTRMTPTARPQVATGS